MAKKKKGGQDQDMPQPARPTGDMPVTSDPRFTAMYSAPVRRLPPHAPASPHPIHPPTPPVPYIPSAPQTFQRIPKDERKFKIDKRFEAVLTDDRFWAVDGGQVDKRGKKMKRRQRVVDDLQAFYTIDKDEKKEEDETEEKGGKDKTKKKKGGKAAPADPRFQLRPQDQDEEEDEAAGAGSGSSGSESSSSDQEEEGATKEEKSNAPTSHNEVEERLEYLNRLARGEVSDASTSSSSESDEDEGDSTDNEAGGKEDEEGDDDDDGVVASRQLDVGPIPMGEATKRLAIMNCDWKHLKAVDLLGVLLSFKPGQGVVKRVTVYYSDFGLEKMAEDAKLGPSFLRDGVAAMPNEEEEKEEGSDDDSSVDSSDSDRAEDGEERIDQEKLRAYEVQKLRYYFAVAECDTVGTASTIYEEVDGLEFENSSSQLDARFVPADVSFKGRKVRDTAEAPLPPSYEPPNFVTKALQQTKVECTWDQGDEERERKLTQYHKWHEMDDDDLGAYLASSSSESEAEEEEATATKDAKRKKLRSMLLGGIVEDEEEEEVGGGGGGDGYKEVTFVPGASSKSKWAKDKAAAAEAKAKENETPFEKLLRKRKEKRKEKRVAKKLAAKGGGVDEEEFVGEEEEDDFFAEAVSNDTTKKGHKKDKAKGKKGKALSASDADEDEEDDPAAARWKEEELELLFAGEDKEEQLRDFDMRALERKEKLKDKKLKGKRKRKEEKRSEAAPGQDFQVDVGDSRFAALFEGDARFGIDRTSKEYKQTEGMQTILSEQTKRRRQKEDGPAVPKRAAPQQEQGQEAVRNNGGAAASSKPQQQPGEKKASSLSKLVQKFKK